MIQSYKKNPQIDDQYHSILIGSGMGSLSAAAILAKEGHKVLVLERHYTAGGYTHIFKRKGFEWDVGIHYIGDMQRPESAMKKLFDYVTNGQLKWADMGEVYDRIIIGDRSYDLVKGLKNFKQKLISYFPDEEEAIHKYIDLVFRANKTAGKFYMNKALPPFLSKLTYKWMSNPFFKYADQTTYEVISSLTDNQELIKVLTGQYGDYGLPPKESSFFMHATVAKHYFGGGSFPVGGSSQIVKTIDPVIEMTGGTIIINAEVKNVHILNNKACGVEMTDGRIINSDHVISGAGLQTTYEKLLPEEVVNQHKLKDQVNKVNPSASHACLYIGLDGSPEELKLPKTNLWIYPENTDHDTSVKNYLENIDSEFPVVYVSFPAAKDPDWSNRYPGKSTIDIITLLPYAIFESWEGSRWMKRGEAYEELKKKISKRLLEKLYEQLPQVKGKIVHYELSSPLTTQHFMNYSKGEIYGLDHSPGRFRQKFLVPRTPVKNFYLTGQDIVTAGVGGALFSGLLTASALTGKNFMKKII
ncbi:phytoene desaturase family protein [Lutimonas zeaxanthinifaciens]|uniref:phytoene desaturase family protein n=1 Tax=Lutimonas zeaxanthinifaciens TaxID=3060215 RepID=UPI00265D3D0C|nr:NAD(P)/FAD-dependent oxidoreductase [Lutimonas sp. YSD2104]WKK65316.1 NAD(P)/FAD-dependent oxidoreductase [Lutimonas sp. YSD2104]